MASEQFSLCWDNFHKNMSSGMNSLLESEELVDVTLAVEGKFLKAHKMVLSVCSPYFKELFKSNPCQHPIVFMKDVSYVAISDLLQFMYQGEVQVSQDNLTTFIKTAEALQIKGLTGDGNVSIFDFLVCLHGFVLCFWVGNCKVFCSGGDAMTPPMFFLLLCLRLTLHNLFYKFEWVFFKIISGLY